MGRTECSPSQSSVIKYSIFVLLIIKCRLWLSWLVRIIRCIIEKVGREQNFVFTLALKIILVEPLRPHDDGQQSVCIQTDARKFLRSSVSHSCFRRIPFYFIVLISQRSGYPLGPIAGTADYRPQASKIVSRELLITHVQSFRRSDSNACSVECHSMDWSIRS